MSEVIEGQNNFGPVAGNTVATMASTNRDVVAGVPSAADLDAVSDEKEVKIATETAATSAVSNTDDVEELLDEENTFDVNRAEFNELRDLVLSISHGINQYNTGSPHKIPVVSINAVLGIK